MERLKKDALRNQEIAEQIRERDALFSLEGFLANVCNQLAALHFSDRQQDAAAFTESERVEKQIAERLADYKDAIDLRVYRIALSRYETDDLFQKIFLEAELKLLMYHDNIVDEKTERVRMRMIKKASCKTQSVCAPRFMICAGCGAPVSLLAGRRCESCGRDYRLSDFDWVIGDYFS